MLIVTVRVAGSFCYEWFLVRMMKDGRLTIQKLALRLLQEGEEKSLEGRVLEVTVEPATGQVGKLDLNP